MNRILQDIIPTYLTSSCVPTYLPPFSFLLPFAFSPPSPCPHYRHWVADKMGGRLFKFASMVVLRSLSQNFHSIVCVKKPASCGGHEREGGMQM